jgi:hypothetical protein
MIRRAVMAIAVAGLITTGCGSETSTTSTPRTVGDASHVDMCTTLTDAELSGLGIDPNTREPSDKLGAVGCGWLGRPFTLRLERDNEALISYKARRQDPTFVTFTVNTINGRAGAQLQVFRDRTDCSQLMDGGPVSVVVSVALAFSVDPPKIDPCAEALRIAQMIEPRLPKAGT